jgi:hypothetical protein
MFLNCSTCFKRHTAHYQELKNCNCSLWFYIRLWLPAADITPVFLNCSTCFARHAAHHQELKNYNCSLLFYIRLWLPAAAGNHKQRLQLQFSSFWWWAVCRSKHVEQLRNIGIINSATRSHLVVYFYKIYIMMHGSTNIKCIITIL